MTELEQDLRELLLKYNMEIYEISVLLHGKRPILAIGFEEIQGNKNATSKGNKYKM